MALVCSIGQSAFLLDEIEWPMVYPAFTSRGGVEIHGGGFNALTPRRISSGPYLCLCCLETRKRSETMPAVCVVTCACTMDAVENPSFAAELLT